MKYIVLFVAPMLIGVLFDEGKGGIVLILGVLVGLILFFSLGSLDLLRWLVSVNTKHKRSPTTGSASWHLIREQPPTPPAR